MSRKHANGMTDNAPTAAPNTNMSVNTNDSLPTTAVRSDAQAPTTMTTAANTNTTTSTAPTNTTSISAVDVVLSHRPDCILCPIKHGGDATTAVNVPPTDETMRVFTQCRAGRGKQMDADANALRASWDELVRRWNHEDMRTVIGRCENRPLSLGRLRGSIHQACWDDNRACLADAEESCAWCNPQQTNRPMRRDWEDEVATTPLDDTLRDMVAQCQRASSRSLALEAARSARRLVQRDLAVPSHGQDTMLKRLLRLPCIR